MATLIKLSARIGNSITEVWINADQIISLIPDDQRTRIYLTGAPLPGFPDNPKDYIDVSESPKTIRDKVVAEKSTKIDTRR